MRTTLGSGYIWGRRGNGPGGGGEMLFWDCEAVLGMLFRGGDELWRVILRFGRRDIGR
jgi:hypothetical protein